MKKYMFVIASYPDWRQDFYRIFTRKRNQEYCKVHGFEYIEFNGETPSFRGHPTWWKFSKVLDMVNGGLLKDGDVITHLDADMCIVDGRVPLVTNKTFTIAIDSCNTLCCGMYSLRINEWSINLLRNILSEERYQALNWVDTVGSMGETSSFWEIFREQASLYSLFGIKRHSWESFLLLPHWGFHSDVDQWTKYSLEELYEHVEVLGPTWNVTHIPQEDGVDKFYINPTHPDDTIIRHWAGGRQWRKEYFERPMKT